MLTTETRSTCPYCGVGCGVVIESQKDQITGVRGDPDHPANFGRLCSKGSALHLTATAAVTLQTRLLQPLQRAAFGQAPQPVSWDHALDTAADTFARLIAEDGPDSVGFYISGQLLTEDYAVFNKLARGLVGTNNIDSNSRLCMSSAVAGYKQTLGSDAPPACYDDLNHAQCLFISGSNAAWAHPVLFRRIEDAKRANPALKIVVVDPRRTDTCEIADLHLQIQPGTDVLLCHGMLHLMLWEGWTRPDFIAAHTSGFDALKALVRDCTPARVAAACGITEAALLDAARLFATSAATLSLYCQGLNQSASGSHNNAALINLHLATAQIGRPGAGPFSLTGQPNAMGGREVGGMANLLNGHRDLGNPAHRAEVAALWGLSAGHELPARPGKTAVEMFQAAADGEIKALWIACTNPAQSMPDQATVRRALQRCELVVVQEAFATTATCDFAHLLLPATTWGEKTGTVTNSERRISRVRAAVPAAGAARHDWSIAADFARRLEARLPRRAGGRNPGAACPTTGSTGAAAAGKAASATTLFPYPLDSEAGAEAVWLEHRAATRGRDLDITGLSWPLLDSAGPQQWPLPQGQCSGTERLYTDHRFATPDGRARFVTAPFKPLAEPRDARFPFTLNTGRLRDQWHGMSRTGLVARLFGHAPEPAVLLHPQDMARRQLHDGDLVRLTSRRGSIVLPAKASAEVGLSQAFVAMHWGPEAVSGRAADGSVLAGVNALSTPVFCPDSKQPALKHAAVRVERAALPWSLLAAAWLPPEQALAAQRALRALMADFAFATCVPFAGQTGAAKTGAAGAGTAASDSDRSGVLFRAAADTPATPALLARIEALLGLAGADALRYADARQGQRRAARLRRTPDGDVRLDAFLLAGDTRAEAWIRAVLQDDLPAQAFGRLLLRPGPVAPVAVADRGAVVCSCFGVASRAIEQQLARTAGSDDARLAALQQALQCGTNCGSCVPELQRLVRCTPAAAAAAAAPHDLALEPR